MDSINDDDSQLLIPDTTGNNYKYDAVKSDVNLSAESRALDDELENGDHEKKEEYLPIWDICCILSTVFAYGCIMTTLFLITLPVECGRIEDQHPEIPKSVALGTFVAIAGLTQLVSPLVGMLSDTYKPPLHFGLGRRMPFLTIGAVCAFVGLLGQYVESTERLWIRYGVFFFLHMIGLNVCYSMMIALIPDQVPKSQTGVANGVLAFLLVTGSLFGFGLFHFYFEGKVQDMYGLYICIVIFTTILTGVYASDRDAQIYAEIYSRQQQATNGNDPPSIRGSRKRMILDFFNLIKTMLYDPIRHLDAKTLIAVYSIDVEKHHDFFVVTVSRLFYYCGVSVQTYFLYFLQDIIRVDGNAEAKVAYLSVLGQVFGALVCYPVGVASDVIFGGRRKPFVYLACAILGCVAAAMIFVTNMDQMHILCSILGAANGIYLTMETSLAVDSLPDDLEADVSGGHGQLLGIWGVAAFLGSSVGASLDGVLLYVFGHKDNYDVQGYTREGYAVILGLSTFYFLLSAVSLRWATKTKGPRP